MSYGHCLNCQAAVKDQPYCDRCEKAGEMKTECAECEEYFDSETALKECIEHFWLSPEQYQREMLCGLIEERNDLKARLADIADRCNRLITEYTKTGSRYDNA